MAKKLSKSRRRVHHKRKESLFDKLFTFPKLAVYGFVILTVMLLYEVAVPPQEIRGVSTSAFKYKIKMTIFKDPNMNVKRDTGEGCLAKTFKIKVKNVDKNSDGKTTTYSIAGNSNCTKYTTPVITVKGNCNTVQYVDGSLANWILSGINYSDAKKDPGYVYDSNKVKICMYPLSEGLNVPYVAFVNFAMKSK